jgi:prevent-host-death family protein
MGNWSNDHTVAMMGTLKDRVLSASEFKAKCLACLTEMERFGEPITITRRGRPVAVLGPPKRAVPKSPRDSWSRKGRILGDIVNADTASLWEVAGPE